MYVYFLAVSLLTSSAHLPSAVDGPPVLYLVSESTPVRADPTLVSRTTGKLRPFDIVTGRQVNDWLMIESSSGEVESGWIPLRQENVIRGSLETVKRRVFYAGQSRWPDHVKMDVIRGRVQTGFTATQVQLALGDPVDKQLVGTGDDVTETWIYQDTRIAFTHRGVSTIEPYGPHR